MKITNDKHLLIIVSILAYFFIFISILLFCKLITPLALLSMIFILPILFVTDICFILLPFSTCALLLLSLYTLIKNNFEKINFAYALLLILVTLGLINMNIESLYINNDYIYHGRDYKSWWYVFLALALCSGIIYAAKKKDSKIYLFSYTIALIFYLIYQLINILD